MRAVALLGPYAKEHHVRQFQAPGVDLFSGNELDPTDQPEAALIFGGDGTVHRHLAGLAVKQIPTLVVPIGSGNDFAQSIGVDNVAKALAAWQHFCSAGDNIKAIDLGTIKPLEAISEEAGAKTKPDENSLQEDLEARHFVPEGPRRDLPPRQVQKLDLPGTPELAPRQVQQVDLSGPPERSPMGARIMQSQLRRAREAEREIARNTFFTCIAGTGVDAAVNRRALQQSRWLRGHGGYVLALLQTLPRFRPPHITVSTESGGSWHTRVDEPGFLIAAGNGPQYGHGMRLTHRARMDDGLLDLCFVRLMGKLRLLRLFRVVYRGGHVGLKEVEYFRAARLRIATDPVMEVFADGEYICTTPVELGVQRNGLRIIVPA